MCLWWSRSLGAELLTIGDFLGQRVNSVDPSHSTKHLFGRLAIALWRGNATMWLHRTPSLAPSSDGSHFSAFAKLLTCHAEGSVFLSDALAFCTF